MKCICRTGGKGGIRRVPDEEAFKLVHSGKWSYIPKGVWKEKVRDK